MSTTPAEPHSGLRPSDNTRRPRLKYQVFISSTYKDLHKEREKVVWAILEARHIPAGMENFTAADERGWKTITRVIDDTDYYVLILGGLYGSLDPATGMSWTQREYEYAISKRIPVLAFLREEASTPGDMVERDQHKVDLHRKFIERVRSSHLYKTWKVADDLAASVASALRNHIKDDEDDANPRPGWIRGDTIPSMASLDEFARLSADNAKLKLELESARTHPPQHPVLQLIIPKNEKPIADTTVDKTTYKIPDSNQQSYIQKTYLARYNKTIWLRLAVKNSGKTAARNIVVDIAFPDANNTHLRLIRPGQELEDAKNKEAYDTSNHCYVHSLTKTSIRQRIKLVAPGIFEQLVPFGVEMKEAALGGEGSIDFNYSVVDEGGASERGQFRVTVHWAKPKEIPGLSHVPNRP